MPPSGTVLRQVWQENFDKEEEFIKKVAVPLHNYVTIHARVISTRIPVRSSSSAIVPATRSTRDERYAKVRELENTMRMLQLGMTFSDEAGDLPTDPETNGTCIWQFNIRVLNPNDEIDGVDYFFQRHLIENGIDVQMNRNSAINPEVFSFRLCCIDTIMLNHIHWVVFCGTSTFGPLLKLLRQRPLPEQRMDFLHDVGIFFPRFYEMRYLMVSCFGLLGTLHDVARLLGVEVGGQPSNEAGPESLLTLQVFLALRKRFFRGGIPEDKANLILSIS